MSKHKFKEYKIIFSPDDNEVNLYRGQGIITFGMENVIEASIKILNRLEEEKIRAQEAYHRLQSENKQLKNLIIELEDKVDALENENVYLRVGGKTGKQELTE
ncbi:MAG: hypothetical protein FWF59_11370 [Turicibacter sp.]|nr:hypothetical protein [Turicibacter sp.]